MYESKTMYGRAQIDFREIARLITIIRVATHLPHQPHKPRTIYINP